jgi:hypothetical protein
MPPARVSCRPTRLRVFNGLGRGTTCPVQAKLFQARFLRLALGVGALAALAACGRSIGDSCSTNAECSANGDRTCDMSQPGGYCTIEGCDANSCPSDSICVRFFPEQFLTKVCNPAVITDCSADEVCLAVGLCAQRADERRVCEKSCGSDDDCRGGYQCRPGGTQGSMPLLSDPNATASFCAPH